MDLTEFNEIRPYNDEELPQIFEELIADPAFQKAATGAIPNVPFELLAQKMRACKTKLDFQEAFCYGILWKIAADHTAGLTLDHTAIPDKSKAYTYISNHRDIILDSGFLSILLIDQGMDTVEIAIGDNLLIYPWIKKLVRVNKSFIVQRALTMRQMLESSARMSRYMHYTISEKKQSIWIAQREGRAKDNEDTTQPAILKMMALGGEGSPVERLRSLNLVPVSISYEFDPCDYLKAKELLARATTGSYTKSKEEDIISMRQGLLGQKGRVHFTIGTPVNTFLNTGTCDNLSANELYRTIAGYIDRQIHTHYRLYPNNFIAEDLLQASCYNYGEGQYSGQERNDFEDYLAQRIALANLSEENEPFLRRIMLSMYARPLINYRMAAKAEQLSKDL